MRAGAWALLLTVACRDGATRPAGPIVDAAIPDVVVVRESIVKIERVAIEESTWPKEAGPSPNPHELAGELKSDLVASGLFTVDEPRGPYRSASVHALYGFELASGKGRAGAELTLRWSTEEEDFDLVEHASCEGAASTPKEAGGLVECALSSAARGLAVKETIRRGDPTAVLAALAGDDEGRRQVAFAAVADHKIKEAVPRLLELLESPDGAARDGAIGALVALREPRAVGPLTKMAEFKDLAMMRRVVDAVGSIGGEEAVAYLELVASGHDDPTIKAMAEQALARARRRTKP